MTTGTKLYSRHAAAKELGLAKATLQRAIDAGDIRIVELNGRVYISRAELDRLTNPPTDH